MIVLDASALVELVADGPSKAWAAGETAGQPIAAPGHQLAEVVSALDLLVRAGDLDPAGGRAALGEAAALPQEVHPIDAELLDHAWRLRGRIRMLDGLYLALAVRLDVPLVTTDRRLHGADAPCEVRAPAG